MNKVGQLLSAGHSILVTGAGGFVGEALCRTLLREGVDVRACVRGISFIPEGKLIKVNGCFEVPDISAIDDWSTILQGRDVVVHLAARAHVLRETEPDPMSLYRAVNAEATLRLASQAILRGIRRFIYISSIGVNGKATFGVPFNEEMNPSPHSDYAISKWEAEQGLLKLARETRMEVVIIRAPLVYGPRVKGNFYKMMNYLLRGIPMPFGAIYNKRSFVALGNLVDLIVTSIEHPAAANQVFLAGDGVDLSTTELLQRLSSALGKPARLLPVPQRLIDLTLKMLGKGDAAHRLCGSLQVDISKARDMLGWIPPVTVDEGLRKTADWYLRQGKPENLPKR